MTDLDAPADKNPLRHLSLPVRLVLAAFLLTVGFGYLSALVQLHFKEAAPGELLPTIEDVTKHYHGNGKMGPFEFLITEHENRPFNSGGSMRAAFTFKSAGWVAQVKATDAAFGLKDRAAAEKKLREVRDLEAQVVVDWIRAGAKKDSYDVPSSVPATLVAPLKKWEADLQTQMEKGNMAVEDAPIPLFSGTGDEWTANIDGIIQTRCARCHNGSGKGGAGQIDLRNYERVMDYVPPLNDTSARSTSLSHLAQSTHAHLLSFAMLYGLTGLLFACTGYPLLVRLVLAPLPLVAQVVDISFWWLARMDAPQGPMFAALIPVSGGIVGLGLMLQILLGVFALFGNLGRIVLVILMVTAAGAGHVFLKPVVDRQLESEKNPVTVPVDVKK